MQDLKKLGAIIASVFRDSDHLFQRWLGWKYHPTNHQNAFFEIAGTCPKA
jgi:hypothetical protein